MTTIPRPIPKQGPVKGQWLEHQRQCRLAVMQRILRANRGSLACEGCGQPVAHNTFPRGAPVRIEWAHLFGRAKRIPEPWCSVPELTRGLCRQCHRAIDGQIGLGIDLARLDAMRWEACGDMAARYRLAIAETIRRQTEAPGLHRRDPVRVMELIVNALIKADVKPEIRAA